MSGWESQCRGLGRWPGLGTVHSHWPRCLEITSLIPVQVQTTAPYDSPYYNLCPCLPLHLHRRLSLRPLLPLPLSGVSSATTILTLPKTCRDPPLTTTIPWSSTIRMHLLDGLEIRSCHLYLLVSRRCHRRAIRCCITNWLKKAAVTGIKQEHRHTLSLPSKLRKRFPA